jgi:hypothetical protein
MSSARRILFCRLSFVLLAIVPTLGTCGWLVSQSAAFVGETGNQPPDSKALARELSRRLGLTVEFDAAEFTTAEIPDSKVHEAGADRGLRLIGIRLSDPETGELLATAQSADAVSEQSGWQIALSQAQANAQHIGRLVATLHERLLCGSADDVQSGRLQARELIILGGDESLTLVDFVAEYSLTASGPQLVVEFRPAGANSNSLPARLAASRNRDVSPPATLVEIDTAGHPLPVSLCAPFAGEPLAAWGGVTFRGTAKFVPAGRGERGPGGTLAGTFSGLELDRLVSERFPHQLSGRADLVIEQGTLAAGRLQMLRGRLLAGRGGISPSFIAAAREHLGLSTPLGEAALAAERLLPFSRLAISFQLDGQSLELAGQAGRPNENILVVDTQGALLSAPRSHRTAAVNLLRTLVPASEVQVPATQQTSSLVGLFPAPDLVAPRTASKPALRHTPTRLRTSGPADAAPVLRQPGWR